MPPTISVVIATYYRNELLRDAIESVLAQEYEPVELIVVDDSGEAHAKPVLDDYDALTPIVNEDNGGWAQAYTRGIQEASGEYVHLLDDDDYFLPGKLSKTVAVLEENPAIGVAYSGLVSDVRGEQLPRVKGDVLESALMFKTYPCCTITMLIDRELLLDLLPLAEYADDLDLKIELARRTAFDTVDECLVYRRKTESRKWDSLERFAEMKRVVRNQQELYDQFPSIRRAVLAERYEKEGRARLEERAWSMAAIACFLKATYYATETRPRCVGQVVASLLGRPGIETARQVRNASVSSRD